MSAKVLLDTHALLWAFYSPSSLGSRAMDAISDERNTVVVSAVSAWEIATKVRLGKLPLAVKLEANFFEMIDGAGYALRAIEVRDALRAGRLLGQHRDPFDRMLAAQALQDDIPVISADAKLDGFGVRRIW